MEDLFDPAFKGKIGMLTEMRDTVGLMMLLARRRPGEGDASTPPSAAFDRIEEAKDDGQIRQFTGNDYMDDLATGELRRLHRLVGRHRPARPRQPGPALRHPRGGRHAVVATPW